MIGELQGLNAGEEDSELVDELGEIGLGEPGNEAYCVREYGTVVVVVGVGDFRDPSLFVVVADEEDFKEVLLLCLDNDLEKGSKRDLGLGNGGVGGGLVGSCTSLRMATNVM